VASLPQRDGSTADDPAWPTLATILAAGLGLRVVAAFVVRWYAARVGKACLFDDTLIYWSLAGTIVDGTPFVVDQSGIPHYALRTPGYPLFLAACRAAFGDRYLPVRLVQAALGTAGIYFLYRLVARAVPGRSAREVAIAAAALAAVEPYGIGLGALILSEGVFVPLMLAGLWGLAVLWPGRGEGEAGEGTRPGRAAAVAVATGVVHGVAILVRPSWALIVPALLAAWVAGAGRGRRGAAARGAILVAMATAAVMAPWWARNGRVFGRFVPTALWVGASLYDGVSPEATGASDMRFLARPGIVDLDEPTQDAALRARALAFAAEQPGRVASLAVVKASRFWSPWPNAETLRSPAVAWASAAVTIPLFALAAAGARDRRRDPRALILLAGPLVYFLALHLVFVSSIRYRIPGFFPALGLAAVGWRRLVARGAGGRPTG